MPKHPAHIACIIGGAVAGSEAAALLAQRGIHSVVFDMGVTPWGKIELGLPKWHAKQRDMEEGKINEKLMSPYVHYVPSTRLGSDIGFKEIQSMGFSAILLAVGAWKDRPLAVPGIDEYQDRGFYYQNPFVSWFNQKHDPNFEGSQMEIVDDAIVVGGGLASLDVVKILMIETTLEALRNRGVEADFFALEKKGIPKVLASLGLKWEDLNLKGCTLYYRRRAKDMPLVPLDDDADEARLAKAEVVREKLLDNFLSKFLFRFEPCTLPVEKIVEGERLAGLVLRRTEVKDGRARELPGTDFEVRSPLVISSIGSLPDHLPGLEMDGNFFQVSDPETGKLDPFENVFALGNAVTGRGNIRDSRIHAQRVAQFVMDSFLEWKEDDYAALQAAGEESEVDRILQERCLKTVDELQEILSWVADRQRRVGYDGNYQSWVERHMPVRLESMT